MIANVAMLQGRLRTTQLVANSVNGGREDVKSGAVSQGRKLDFDGSLMRPITTFHEMLRVAACDIQIAESSAGALRLCLALMPIQRITVFHHEQIVSKAAKIMRDKKHKAIIVGHVR